MAPKKNNEIIQRFFIAEWFGTSFAHTSPEQRQVLLHYAKGAIKQLDCPFRRMKCNKKGGVCSLRQYSFDQTTSITSALTGDDGRIRTTCPNRFDEANIIYEWVGSVLLGDAAPVILSEIGFLEKLPSKALPSASADDVGKIDNILVAQHGQQLLWCALEKQAVYFQGRAMGTDWRTIETFSGATLPFPSIKRMPDYRSSGPKRLMPQLQIKVPALRRWGKKMAVIVDEDFFEALGPMEGIEDVSNADIAWFVVGYDNDGNNFHLVKKKVHLTTLERAVEGLTAGRPVSLSTFEERIRLKLRASSQITTS